MKAINRYKANWEAENWLKAVILKEKISFYFIKYAKAVLQILSLAIYLIYKAAGALLFVIKLVMVSEQEFKRIERDESWIFRNYK